jgi:hypothetical protein
VEAPDGRALERDLGELVAGLHLVAFLHQELGDAARIGDRDARGAGVEGEVALDALAPRVLAPDGDGDEEEAMPAASRVKTQKGRGARWWLRRETSRAGRRSPLVGIAGAACCPDSTGALPAGQLRDRGIGDSFITMDVELTARQAEILEVIRTYVKDHGRPPSRPELAKLLGIASTNGVFKHLDALARKGALELVPNAARGIRLTEPPGLPSWGASPPAAPSSRSRTCSAAIRSIPRSSVRAPITCCR